MGTLRFQVNSDLRFRIVSADGDGNGVLESVAERVWGTIEATGLGIRFPFDSRNVAGSGSPVGELQDSLCETVGKVHRIRLSRRGFPEEVLETGGGGRWRVPREIACRYCQRSLRIS